MIIGPVFSREALTAPRRPKFFAVRTLMAAVLLGLVLTAWQVVVGSQQVSGPGELARFGATVFAQIAPLVLTVCILFSALLTAAAVSQEKDRKTLLLLLLSELTNSELVLGKLLASLLTVLVVIASTAPVLLAIGWLGGVSLEQVGRVLVVTVFSALAAGSLGSVLALWREKTFQALAMSALVIVLWSVGWEIVGSGALGERIAGVNAADAAAMASPWRAIRVAVAPGFGPNPPIARGPGSTGEAGPGALVAGFAAVSGAIVFLLNAVAILRVRVWNPSREARPRQESEEHSAGIFTSDSFASDSVESPTQRASVHAAPGKLRPVWNNPILWREVRTWAYGKKIIVVRLAYLAIFALCVAGVVRELGAPQADGRTLPPIAAPLAPLLVVSVVLVNALAVTSITGERDAKALDLLLATDLTPKEIIFGKLAGAFYNAKEMILLPIALCCYLGWVGALGGENLAFMIVGLLAVDVFAAVLGLHAGMIYPNSQHAIATSIGTLLFLFLGVSFCMRMMVELSESFDKQLVPFLGFMAGGGLALFAALAWRNPSRAMMLACFSAPAATFYAITSFLLMNYSGVFLASIAACGFFTAAMLVPALAEFDVATGRTAARD
ncbi:ABC-2 family transporter protein [Pirellulimonas nuda]|uniref:ABC-2 family transporter protein n=1 Tax=Pirellulimonas nuda TaxID=2528009 RepID=A0A518DA04_9BACT|nr:ABC transporter permease subunit [Pirellulimonas nuda]QDU88312.1 ABC-2 family transporter protein [Pirellulimonas nuda]